MQAALIQLSAERHETGVGMSFNQDIDEIFDVYVTIQIVFIVLALNHPLRQRSRSLHL